MTEKRTCPRASYAEHAAVFPGLQVRSLPAAQCVALRQEWQKSKRFCRELWS